MGTITKVDKDRLARDLAERLKGTPADAARCLRELCDLIRRHLQAGHAVELGDLLSISVAGGPEIREDDSGGFSAFAAKNRVLAATPLGTLRQDLQRAGAGAIYYLSRDNTEFQGLLADHFGRRGWRLVQASSAASLQAKLENDPPMALLVESQIQGWRELVRDVKCNMRTNGVPVVAVFRPGELAVPAPSLTLEPDDVICEPFQVQDFIRIAATELAARVAAPQRELMELRLSLPGSRRERQAARELLEEVLFRNQFAEDFTRDASAALDEVLDNAVRHGHRAVECCTISVRIILDPRRLVMAVRDSGGGFDHPAILAAARASRPNRETGSSDHLLRAAAALKNRKGPAREGGMSRILKLVDRIEFNRLGNEVVMTKFRPGAGESAGPGGDVA